MNIGAGMFAGWLLLATVTGVGLCQNARQGGEVRTSPAQEIAKARSVAVPFVGMTAAALVVAEALRLFHVGPAYTDMKVTLSALRRTSAPFARTYQPQDCAGLKYCDALRS